MHFSFFPVTGKSLILILFLGLFFCCREVHNESHSGDTSEPSGKISAMVSHGGVCFGNNNRIKGDSLLNAAIILGEGDDDKKLLIQAYLGAGEVYKNNALKEKALDYFQKAYKIASGQKLKNEEVVALLHLAGYYAYYSNYGKDLEFLNKVDISDDDITDENRTYYYLRKAEYFANAEDKIGGFRSLFSAQKYALQTGNKGLVRKVNLAFGNAYFYIGEYESALEKFRIVRESFNADHLKSDVISTEIKMGNIYGNMDNLEMAKQLFETSIKEADRLGDNGLKYRAIDSLFDMYIEVNDFKSAVETENNYKLSSYLRANGDMPSYYITRALCAAYFDQPDSSRIYYKLAIDACTANNDTYTKISYMLFAGNFFSSKGDIAGALNMFRQGVAISDSAKILTYLPDLYTALDNGYLSLGDYKNAYTAKSKFLFYTDSMQAMGRKDEILKDEITAEEVNQKRLTEEEEQEKHRRFNLQYMGIIVSSVMLLIILLILGFFNVPKWLIQALGFLSFIFLFEFIIIVLDTKIHEWTHGEPLPVLLIKVGIACLLVPLHHYTEEKVIVFLQSRKLHKLRAMFKEDPRNTEINNDI